MSLTQIILLLCLLLTNFSVSAVTRIAILDFELKDLTLAPGIPAELSRTASIRPLLEHELGSAGYQLVNIPSAAQQTAQSGGVGYLFDHPDVAGQLGKQFGADYVLVGRLHKPSFLFAYLLGNLVRVNNGKLIGKFITESKGSDQQLTQKAVETMTVKIDQLLDRRYTPPVPAPHHSSD